MNKTRPSFVFGIKIDLFLFPYFRGKTIWLPSTGTTLFLTYLSSKTRMSSEKHPVQFITA